MIHSRQELAKKTKLKDPKTFISCVMESLNIQVRYKETKYGSKSLNLFKTVKKTF